ncbi:heterokaryon incompatibility protein-domain-containing protein [Apiosordaria backusii]|uniref:Heterokaryon incompatibility protein-domain-containing protein n=1 Tax=Apiosordaria backusii TaxID=314023 RepID=A0AA40A401_9PEZI|nr:heterokaryon incompatibility protein-domain-containing protein [Apiosordaria backusii]
MSLFAPYRYRSLPHNDSIRILRIIPNGQRDAPIRCAMGTRRLSELTPPYEALSYTWGDASDRVTIHIGDGDGDTQLMVTRNCFSALKNLRQSDCPRAMWVDAVCINQEDDEERSHQVRMMERIYATAVRTVVYLGEETPSSRILFADLARTANGPFKRSDRATDTWEPDRPAPDANVLSALEALLDRPWFYRIWVVQEVYVSDQNSMLVMCGAETAAWKMLYHCLHGYQAATLAINRSAAPGVLTPGRFYNRNETPTWWNLWRALDSTRPCLATDPRDKVFALRALLGPGNVNLDYLIDYSKSLETVLAEVAEYLLLSIGLVLLLASRHSHSRTGLASWAPDWSQTKPLWGLDAFGGIVRRLMNNTPKRYVDARPDDFSFSFSNTLEYSPGILRVDGWRIGSITGMGTAFKFNGINDANQQLTSIRNATRRLNRDEKITKDDVFPSQINHHGIISALNLLTTVEMRQLFGRGVAASGTEDELHSMTLDWLAGREGTWTIQEAERHLNDCKFFVVGESFIGIAPEGTRESDLVFIVKNAYFPCILRQAPAGRWHLISGDCYLMDLDQEVGCKEVQFSVGGIWDGPGIDGLSEEQPEKLEIC